jgi:hypothetical protein
MTHTAELVRHCEEGGREPQKSQCGGRVVLSQVVTMVSAGFTGYFKPTWLMQASPTILTFYQIMCKPILQLFSGENIDTLTAFLSRRQPMERLKWKRGILV